MPVPAPEQTAYDSKDIKNLRSQMTIDSMYSLLIFRQVLLKVNNIIIHFLIKYYKKNLTVRHKSQAEAIVLIYLFTTPRRRKFSKGIR